MRLARLALALPALAGLRAGGPQGAALEVSSPNGRYVARVAKLPGQEAVADALARWELAVQELAGGAELWSMRYPHDPAPARYFLADDGSTFVRLGEAFSESRPVLRMDRFGTRTVERTGADFALAHGDVVRDQRGARWLVEPGDACEWGWAETGHGPALMLKLASQRGWSRDVDVSMGLILGPLDPLVPSVIPGFPEGTGPSQELQVPYVTRASIPPAGLGMLPLRIEVEGQHATPNWKLFGFALAHETPERLVLTPYSQPPPAGSFQAQVIEGFRAEALLLGLEPGRYELAVHGAEPGDQRLPFQAVEILPGRLWLRLQSPGGTLAEAERIEVFKPGVARWTRDPAAPEAPRHLRPDELERLRELAGELPQDPPPAPPPGSGGQLHRLGWWTGIEWREVALDDDAAPPWAREMAAFLRGL